VIWGPFLLALALGIIVSAGLYFAYLWPQVEPDDEAVDAASAGAASTAGKPDSTTADVEPPTDEANADAGSTDKGNERESSPA
jgi:hypothetical protein